MATCKLGAGSDPKVRILASAEKIPASATLPGYNIEKGDELFSSDTIVYMSRTCSTKSNETDFRSESACYLKNASIHQQYCRL